MPQSTQIAFIHRGNSWYLPYVIRQAAYVARSECAIALLSDRKQSGIGTVQLGSLENTKAERFLNCYEHMSNNPHGFEEFCFLRWFYLLEYMRRESIDNVFHVDSDVLLYSSTNEIQRVHNDLAGCALIIPDQDHESYTWCVSGHISYWNISYLERFCDFVIKTYEDPRYLAMYKEKWAWHSNTGTPGGICDMTTLYLFWRENRSSITNFAADKRGTVFDSNVSSSMNKYVNEYVMEDGLKKIAFIDESQPVFYKTEAPSDPIRVHGIHFQGGAKQYIPHYYTAKKSLRMRTDKLRRRLSLRRRAMELRSRFVK
jgi:hypothetical protein